MAEVITLQLQLQLLLLLLHLVVIVFLVATSDAATLNITNRCSFTVWPAAVPVGGGKQLDPGQTWSVDVPAGTTSGRVWARTGCSFDGNGNGSCQTGDCGGRLACKTSGKLPANYAEFSFGSNGYDFFDISLVDGFNLPMDFLPAPAPAHGKACSKGPRCAVNITAQCPSELTVPGGCKNTCCQPNNYSMMFVRMCPDAYIYPQDVASATYTCPSGIDYQLHFCPDLNPTAPLPAPNSQQTASLRSSARGGSIAAAVVVPVFVSLVVVFILCFLCNRRARRRHRQDMEEAEEDGFGELQGLPVRFTFQQLQAATEQFRDKLGEGGFGSVFKGQLGDEQIAVKRLDRAGQGKREFLAEIQTIGSIHHINLVRLIGFCAEKSQRLLVYEYMPNGSLDRWLYYRHVSNTTTLDWQTRRKIITHVAKGLSYLHEECNKRIAHLDVKPQNILLDDNFDAKLSDFGLCKLIDRDKSQVVTRMRGTPGYLAPEWLTSQITEKADIYSFGIVVMEIISGRKNLDYSRSEESIHLITLLEEKAKSDQLVDLIDTQCIDMVIHKQEVIQMMKLAMWCLQIDCKRRPQMSEVIKVLEGTMNVETNIDHSFVATNPLNFGIAGNVDFSAPALALDLSGPR